MSTDSKMIVILKAKLAAQEAEMAALKARVELLEETRPEAVEEPVKKTKAAKKAPKKERDPDAPKPEANSWIKYTKRVNEVLIEAAEGLDDEEKKKITLPGSEQKQFCSMLADELREQLGKDKKDKLTAEDYESISAETILSKRETWVKPTETKWDLAHPDDEKVKERKSRKSSIASGTESDASAASAASEKKAKKALKKAEEKTEEVVKKGRGRPKKVKEADAAPAPEVVIAKMEAALAEEDEDEEEVIEDVELVTVNGKEYYKSEFNDLFDSDTMAYVGEFVSSKKEPKWWWKNEEEAKKHGKPFVPVPPPRRVTEYLEKANE